MSRCRWISIGARLSGEDNRFGKIGAPLLFAVIVLSIAALGVYLFMFRPAAGPSEELVCAPGTIVESLPRHRSLKERQWGAFDVMSGGGVILLADEGLYDLVGGKPLTGKDDRVRSFCVVDDTVVVVTVDDRIAHVTDRGLAEAGNCPLLDADLIATSDGGLLFSGLARDAGEGTRRYFALVEIDPGGKARPLCGSPQPIAAAASNKRQTWFAVGRSLFRLLEPGYPILVLSMPGVDDDILGLVLVDSTLYFSTSDTVYVLGGGIALPVVLGIGGKLRVTDDGLLVFDAQRRRIYRLKGGC